MKHTSRSFAFLASASLLIASLSQTSLRANEVATEGAEVGKWTMDYEAALALAGEKDLPMLLNFTGSDWCGWCKLMDGAIYSTPEWSKYAAANIVLVTIDFPSDKSIVPKKFVQQNETLKGKFGIRGYPSYVILESDGETKLGQLGAGKDKTPASFIKEVEDVLKFRQSSIDSKVKSLGDTKGAEYLAAIESFKNSEKALKDWIATSPKRNEENNEKFAKFQSTIAEARKKLDSF